MNNWFDYIMLHARAQPEKPAMVMEDRVVTYGMLRAAIERCAHRIVALNIAPDGPVAVLVKNPIRHFTLGLALFRVGIEAVSLEHSQSGIKDLKFTAVLGDNGAASLIDPDNRFIEVPDAWFSQDVPAPGELPNSFSERRRCPTGPRIDSKTLLRDRPPLGRGAAEPSIPLPPRPPRPRSAPRAVGTCSAASSAPAAVWRRARA
jgi:acyl-CoA synthetase (AMP-forming)/AMP-acid ligase II